MSPSMRKAVQSWGRQVIKALVDGKGQYAKWMFVEDLHEYLRIITLLVAGQDEKAAALY